MADSWKILSQKPGTEISPSGTGFDDVWNVTYQVTSGPAKGTTGVISVPEEDHNAAFVKSAIDDKVSDLNEIANL